MKNTFMKTTAFVMMASASVVNGFASEGQFVANGRNDSESPMTVLSVHKENPEGKLLTMEDVILSREIHPQRSHAGWTGNGTFRYLKDNVFMEYDVMTRNEIEYKAEENVLHVEMKKALPETAMNKTPSGNWSYLAFTDGQSLYYIDSHLNTYSIARSSDESITYGQTVSRNEFGIDGGIFWAPDNKQIAYYRKDEKLVTDFPLLDITTRTGTLKNIKYPMNGMSSENVQLWIYNLSSDKSVRVDVNDFGYDQYLTNISWSPDSRHIFIQVLDRSQKNMNLNMYRASDGAFVKTILTEHNDRFIEPSDPLHWLGGTEKFIYRTDNRDGYKNLYLCDTLGHIERLTKVDADVQFVAENGKTVFYTSAEVSPAENHLFGINVSISRNGNCKFGEPVRMTSEEGWHNVSFNEDKTWFLDSYSSFNVPGVTMLHSTDGKITREISSSPDPLAGYATGEMTFGTVKSADGKYDNHFRLYKPVGFDPAKKYPVILYVYGGPHSQMVTDSWLGNIRMWEMYMAQRGYIVYVQDNRGTQNHGAEYEKAIHRHCGQAEMADQMAGIHAIESLPYVDSGRIGVHGWSYGGFMTISLMTNYPETFKTGVAGGPVIDWKWYEIMYGERYMETELTNPDGFRETSLINKARDLKGKLLICQGAIDNTVVWEHSLSFIRECIKNNVQVDYFPYPCAEHNVFGKDRVHLMDKVTMYFDDYL